MSSTQLAAQQLAQAIARFRLADRDAQQAIARLDQALAAHQHRPVAWPSASR